LAIPQQNAILAGSRAWAGWLSHGRGQRELYRNYKYAAKRLEIMNLSIPLFSTPLLIAAALIALGFITYLLSARLGVVLMGAGSIIMGAVAIFDLPNGMGLQSLVLFGMTVLVGGWMVYVGVRNG
jgi:hypothetical protein